MAPDETAAATLNDKRDSVQRVHALQGSEVLVPDSWSGTLPGDASFSAANLRSQTGR
jgi:hypothetical protein